MAAEEREKIKKSFLKIAENPIGKTLLYRILIEIRKSSEEIMPLPNLQISGANLPFDELFLEDENVNNIQNISKLDLLKIQETIKNRALRNKNKHLKFLKDSEDIAYSESDACIFIRFDWLDTDTDFQVVGKEIVNDHQYHIVTESTKKGNSFAHGDVWLFHGMLHWYHFLHDRKRYDNYAKGKTSTGQDADVTTHEIGKIFYGNYNANEQAKKKNSIHPWEEFENCSYEEMMTILGGEPNTKKGDELSENAYRLYSHLPMRFGHCTCEYLEDKIVIENAKDNPIKIQRLMSEPDMQWRNWQLKNHEIKREKNELTLDGIGNAKISDNHDDNEGDEDD